MAGRILLDSGRRARASREFLRENGARPIIFTRLPALLVRPFKGARALPRGLYDWCPAPPMHRCAVKFYRAPRLLGPARFIGAGGIFFGRPAFPRSAGAGGGPAGGTGVRALRSGGERFRDYGEARANREV